MIFMIGHQFRLPLHRQSHSTPSPAALAIALETTSPLCPGVSFHTSREGSSRLSFSNFFAPFAMSEILSMSTPFGLLPPWEQDLLGCTFDGADGAEEGRSAVEDRTVLPCPVLRQ